jgi:hypothetical protein
MDTEHSAIMEAVLLELCAQYPHMTERMNAFRRNLEEMTEPLESWR